LFSCPLERLSAIPTDYIDLARRPDNGAAAGADIFDTAVFGFLAPTFGCSQLLQAAGIDIEYRFYKAYEMEIEDKRTVYGECAYRLVPREDEPSVCLMHDWIYLPSA